MAIQTVNVGTTPNDGTGDPVRTCFGKINANFTDSANAASKLVATPAQALAGTANVLTDAAGVHSAIRGLAVGTVSQSGGVPTGAIIERGSNANGEYVKFADGTQICTHNILFTIPNSNEVSVAWTFPASFLNAGYTSNAQWRGSAPGSAAVFYNNDLNTASSVTFYAITTDGSVFSAVGTTREVSAVAIGRWY